MGLAVLVPPASAHGQESGESATSVTLEIGSFDRQLTHVPLKLTCKAAPEGASDCQVTVRAAWSLVNPQTGQRQTEPDVFASVPASVSVGATSPVDVDESSLGLRDKVAAANGKSAALLEVEIVDGAGVQLDFGSTVGFVPPFKSFCHLPRSVSFAGGPAEQKSLDGKRFEPLVSGRLDSFTDTKVGGKRLRFSLYGVKYEFAPRARFSLQCSALGSYAHGKPFPTVIMREGKVHVTGKPRGYQYVASIYTPEGSLGSRSKERVDFTVTRKPAAHKSILRVEKGHTTQITPVDSTTRSPCTDGQALSVDRRGHVRRLH